MFNFEKERELKKDMLDEEVEAASNNGYLKQEGLLVSSCDNAVPSPVFVGRMVGPTRRSTKRGWTEEEDKILAAAVKNYSCRNWRKIESEIGIFKLNRQMLDQKINSTRNLGACSLDLSIERAHIRDCQSPTSEKSHCNNARKDENDIVKAAFGTSVSRVTSASNLRSKDSRTCESNARTIESRDNISALQHRKDTLNDKSKVFKSTEEIDHRRLCYQSLQLKDFNVFLETKELPITNSYICRVEDSTYFFQNTGSSPKRNPEYILKSAAKSFKNLPSIIRRK